MNMENARVVYATRTQHSKKIAAAIAQALDTKAVDVTDNPRVPETELLFIVAGIYGGDSLPELLSFVTNLDPQSRPAHRRDKAKLRSEKS